MKSFWQAVSLGLGVAGAGLIVLLLLLAISGRLFLPATGYVGIAGVALIFLSYLARRAGQ